MSKLIVDQQTIYQLFSNKKADFLIPDYQRPYAWGEEECQTLWDDVFAFAFPDDDSTKFNSDDDEYFLGPIVTFKNNDGKLEIIDGQQRLTTLMLLLRAFFSKFGYMKGEEIEATRDSISKCIWKTNEFGKPDMNRLKIDSEVSSDDDKEEFLTILKNGDAPTTMNSRYARTYRFFMDKIDDFLSKYPIFFAFFPTRILNNCILLPIEAESQDTALRIFSTLNDRGKPLSDTDIFKAQFYKYYGDKGEKATFVNRWKNLEELCDNIFVSNTSSPMDELFTRYMYYERAKQGNKQTTTEALRKFYEKDKYALLKRDQTLTDLEELAEFWKNVYTQDENIFSERILRRLGVLQYAPNGMWVYLLSVYFMSNKKEDNSLEESELYDFLNTIIGFIWAYAVLRPGVNALRTPVYPEMINIVNHQYSNFDEFKYDSEQIRQLLSSYEFTNGRPITKSILAWWAYNDDNQELFPSDLKLEIEHIYPRKRQDNEHGLTSGLKALESIGNKALLEKNINIRASDYRFGDKKRYYQGIRLHKAK